MRGGGAGKGGGWGAAPRLLGARTAQRHDALVRVAIVELVAAALIGELRVDGRQGLACRWGAEC